LYDIDPNNDFNIREDPRIGYQGALYVRGAEKSMSRACEQFLRNLRWVSTYRNSSDLHWRGQIFFPYHAVAVRDFHDPIFNHQYKAGDHPLPYTEADTMEIEFGYRLVPDPADPADPSKFTKVPSDPSQWKWGVNPAMSGVIQIKLAGQNEYTPVDLRAIQRHFAYYNAELDRKGKYKLQFWPYHCMAESIGHAQIAVSAETAAFWGFARGGRQMIDFKGSHYLSERSSVSKEEVMTTVGNIPIAQRNTIALDMLRSHDAVIKRGQAKSHCFAWSVDDMISDIMDPQIGDPSLAKKVWLVTDCTDPVIVPGVRDFTPEADAAIERAKAAGMNVITSDVPFPDFLPVR